MQTLCPILASPALFICLNCPAAFQLPSLSAVLNTHRLPSPSSTRWLKWPSSEYIWPRHSPQAPHWFFPTSTIRNEIPKTDIQILLLPFQISSVTSAYLPLSSLLFSLSQTCYYFCLYSSAYFWNAFLSSPCPIYPVTSYCSFKICFRPHVSQANFPQYWHVLYSPISNLR